MVAAAKHYTLLIDRAWFYVFYTIPFCCYLLYYFFFMFHQRKIKGNRLQIINYDIYEKLHIHQHQRHGGCINCIHVCSAEEKFL